MMCADLMMRRARLFGPLLASGCEVLISGKGTRRVRLFDGERAWSGTPRPNEEGNSRRRVFWPTRPYDVSAMTGPYSKVRMVNRSGRPASWDRCRIVRRCASPPWRRRKESVPWEWTWTIRTDCPTGSCGSCSLPKSSHHCVWSPRWNVGRPSARRRPPRRRCPHWTGRGLP